MTVTYLMPHNPFLPGLGQIFAGTQRAGHTSMQHANDTPKVWYHTTSQFRACQLGAGIGCGLKAQYKVPSM